MIRTIQAALNAWHDDPRVHAVVIEGAGDRAFCAGGDIRAIRNMSLRGDAAGKERFFSEEYALNLAIARYPKPYVALIGGICMGGGIGLSVHGTFRVASETAQFAMPETGIGMFPDVGATFALPRLRGDWGMYLALTGARVGGADATWLGLATHFVPGSAIARLADDIAADGIGVLAAAAIPPPLTPLVEENVAAFGAGSVDAVLAALQEDGSPFAQSTLQTLYRVSPSALLWTFEIVRAGAGRTLEQCQAAELALTRQVTIHPDFLEGVRAMVIDKDRNPSWTPSTIEAVNRAALSAMFKEG